MATHIFLLYSDSIFFSELTICNMSIFDIRLLKMYIKSFKKFPISIIYEVSQSVVKHLKCNFLREIKENVLRKLFKSSPLCSAPTSHLTTTTTSVNIFLF